MPLLRARQASILVLVIFSATRILFALIFSLITHLFSKKLIKDRELSSPFECGFSTKDEGRLPFSLRFFLVALIFLIFDVELLLLFPFLRGLRYSYSILTIMSYFLFLFILSLGLFYEWNRGILESS